MTIQLGRGRSGEPETLLSLLGACHERIRSFIALGVRVAEPGHAPAQRADACARVARYFAVALPLHVRDEEDSLLPRLRGRAPALDAALAALAHEHALHEAYLAALLDGCAEVASHGPTDAALARVAEASARLAPLLEQHLGAEEAEVFPHVQALPEPEQRAILAELRARRRA